MKSKLLFLLILLIYITPVFAWRDGDQVTQKELDETDLKTINLDCKYEGFAIDFTRLHFFTSCQSLEEIDLDNYVVLRKKIEVINFFISDISKCVSVKKGEQTCFDAIKKSIIFRHSFFRKGIITKLVAQQVRGFKDSFDPNGKILIDDSELNK